MLKLQKKKKSMEKEKKRKENLYERWIQRLRARVHTISTAPMLLSQIMGPHKRDKQTAGH